MHERHVLEQLRPHRNLKKLTIASYGGSEFPSWMKDPSFPIMTHLILKDCKRCTSLPALGQLSSLKVLHIKEWEYWFCPDAVNEVGNKRCPKLESFPETGLPPMLRSLKGLKSLPHNYSSCALESLEIRYCPSLRCFPNGELPTTLKSVWIEDCENLESLPEGMMHHNSTCCLEKLKIKGCPRLESFPDTGLPPLLRRLVSMSENMCPNNSALDNLVLERYPNLKILPECLHSLKSLRIINCEGLECFPARGLSTPTLTSLLIAIGILPEDGMPPNLISLEISHCENLKKPILAFHTLTSLSSLTIEMCFQIWFPFRMKSVFFPYLSPPSYHCNGIPSLPVSPKSHLSSIPNVKCCPNLRSLGSMPATLEKLQMGCPILKKGTRTRKENIGPTSLTFHTLK
ncbi:putative disease resistance RPP13-like protein 1 [Vitis vinifera]|uniref:Putative disease resistance RPP13-like protein 1 n=1 Tax=Vitis vinifera TaxID=29760 RepID=A0A438FT73_VITVI|nr:putative disease resistance RPP13-like protein 1 [Vitis vinifera]